MKFYEFLDKTPEIGRLVVVEGLERLFAERAIATVIERRLAPHAVEMNLERIDASDSASLARAEAAAASLPFLGESRVVVLRGAHDLRAELRRELVEVAERTPDGNTLVIEDLVASSSKRPEPLGKLLGKSALRVDTTAGADGRGRFVREELARLGTSAEPAAIAALVEGSADLIALRADLEKLAIDGGRITLESVLREALVTAEVKAYRFAGAAVGGRTADALALAHEMLAQDRGAAVPLLAALAAEYGVVWETARADGQVPARFRWRERELRAAARRLGERGGRRGFERAVRGFEALVTGRTDDPRSIVDIAVAESARSS